MLRKEILLPGVLLVLWGHWVVAQTPDRGLVAHYKFNKSLKDASGNGNQGSIIGALRYGEDRFGNECSALYFDGNSFVQVPHSNSLSSPRRSLTISAWINVELGGNINRNLMWFTIVAKGNRSSEYDSNPHYRFQVSSETISINTEITENVSVNIMPKVWYHAVLTYDGRLIRTYLNGDEIFIFPYSAVLSSNRQPLEIGRDVPGSTEYHVGRMDDVRIYDRALDRNEVLQLYNDDLESSGTGVVCNGADPFSAVDPAPTPVPQVRIVRDTIYQDRIVTRVDTIVQYQQVYVHDTVYQEKVIYQNDTITRYEEVYVRDTVEVEKTIFKVDTVFQEQTVYVTDTVFVPRIIRDTVYRDQIVRQVDTVYVPETIYDRDTVYVEVPRIDTVFVARTDTVFTYQGTPVGHDETFILENIMFERSRAVLLPQSEADLDELMRIMNESPELIIQLEGHTDNQGDPRKNLELSKKRVETIKNELIKAGIVPARIKIRAFGQSRPLNQNLNEQQRRRNRRVEVRVMSE